MYLRLEAHGRVLEVGWREAEEPEPEPDGPQLDHMPPTPVQVEPLGFRRLDDPLRSTIDDLRGQHG